MGFSGFWGKSWGLGGVWLRFGVSSGRDPLEAPSLAIHSGLLLSSYVGVKIGRKDSLRLKPQTLEAETLSSSIDFKSKFN